MTRSARVNPYAYIFTSSCVCNLLRRANSLPPPPPLLFTVMSDLHGMGYEIVSYVVVDVKDSNGYMDALGATQTALVKREAAEGVSRNEVRPSEERRTAGAKRQQRHCTAFLITQLTTFN